MEVGKENMNKSKSLLYKLCDNKFAIWWCGYFLYRALYGNCSVGNGDCVWNEVHGSLVSVFFYFYLVPWRGLVIRSLTNGTEYDHSSSMNHSTEL